MKRPSFQFYPADWRKDAALQSCSIAARGLWIEMICVAHECEPYGHLVVNGRAMSDTQIGRLVGVSERDAKKLICELLDAGVCNRDEKGAIFSRRMAADEDLRERRAAGGKAGSEHGSKGASHGSKGGRPRKEVTPQETPLDDGGRGVFEPPKEPPKLPPVTLAVTLLFLLACPAPARHTSPQTGRECRDTPPPSSRRS